MLGFTIVFLAMLTGVIVVATGVTMAIRLDNLRRRSNEIGEMLEERRRIVNPSLVIIGVAAALWAALLVLDLWWNIGSGFPFNRIFRLGH